MKKKEVSRGSQVNKQAMYIAPKSTNESRAHFSLEPARGTTLTLVSCGGSQQEVISLTYVRVKTIIVIIITKHGRPGCSGPHTVHCNASNKTQ